MSSDIGAIASQPENQNFLSPVGFRFGIRKMPHVNWFLQSVNIPGITMGEASQPTPFIDAAQPGEKLTYEERVAKVVRGVDNVIGKNVEQYEACWDKILQYCNDPL